MGHAVGGKKFALNNKKKASYLVVNGNSFQNITSPCFFGERNENIVSAKLPEQYILQLKDACIIGGSSVIICNTICRRRILYDMLVTASSNVEVIDEALVRTRKPLHIKGLYFAYFKKKINIPYGISLCVNFSWNYYHFIYECLAKFYLIEKSSIPMSVPILVDSVVRNVESMKTLLSIFCKNRQIVYIDKYTKAHINTRYFPSNVNVLPPQIKDIRSVRAEDVVFDLTALQYLRGKILEFGKNNEPSNLPKYRYIFISRKNRTNRAYNEDEVVPLIKEFNYTILCPDTLTVPAPTFVFSNADYIVAASGAALSNIICCKPGCKILVFSLRSKLSIFSTIATAVGAELRYFPCTPLYKDNLQSPFTVNIQLLSETLPAFHGKR